ncbi:N-acetylmuramic acid 6-phosphate etherase [Rhizobium sp. KVB221]|uniref:N-acetylmuramic acid 6-phosphate etherase n=1 Tax=Rhizobium setariae TaxID=2801340 RepID=A0A936YMN5_9HYPH|nr:N-acetylmuramic acid 6-phosphate etherase [Rhizobium setariae]MBL0372318.1 N-acetylmuramic acid 6-phosphate etherase [Rhizobium setariae]
MAARGTEAQNENARGIDTKVPTEILRLLSAAQQQAAKSVDGALDAIAEASALAAQAVSSGRKLIYAGAGSSGLMAMADALELHGTYGIPQSQIVILLAGGLGALSNLAGAPEDDLEQAKEDAQQIDAGDCVICVSASGSTPYALALVEVARAKGAKIVAIANNQGATLFEGADVAVLLETPPEMVSGSTRMGAGTAQKIALNMLSTLMAVRLGHVHDGYMVNLQADNKKLQNRAARIVSEIAGIEIAQAVRFVDVASGSVKTAILLAAGAEDRNSAEAMLRESGHNVRRALGMLGR